MVEATSLTLFSGTFIATKVADVKPTFEESTMEPIFRMTPNSLRRFKRFITWSSVRLSLLPISFQGRSTIGKLSWSNCINFRSTSSRGLAFSLTDFNHPELSLVCRQDSRRCYCLEQIHLLMLRKNITCMQRHC
jgi:hypothetical protein